MILELCDSDDMTPVSDEPLPSYDKRMNPFECDNEPTTSKSRFSFSDVKFPNMKRLMKAKREKQTNGLCLKITTSKMRCSIKVKEEFENDASKFFSRIPLTSLQVIHLQAKFTSKQRFSSTTFFRDRGEVNPLRQLCPLAGITLTQR
jgi:hypothetical protein